MAAGSSNTDAASTAVPADMPLQASSLAAEPSFLLARSTARSLALGNAALQPFGLKVRSYSILAAAASPARPSQRDLASFLKMDPSQVVAVVDELEERALVTRAPDPKDRRANAVVATDAGVALARDARQALAQVDDQVFAGLEPAELDMVYGLLRRVAFPDNPGIH